MKPFLTCRSRAAYLPDANIDTDAIFPARYLLLLDREGMGEHLFHDKRFAPDGRVVEDFVLNDPAFKNAEIIIAGTGFGCGSSREQAVWALDGYGIRCIIAPSFGDIFAGNCLKNGILTVELPAEIVADLGHAAMREAVVTVNLPARSVSLDKRPVATFAIAEDDAAALLNGWDQTMRILKNDGDAIRAFEACHRKAQPWLFQQEITS